MRADLHISPEVTPSLPHAPALLLLVQQRIQLRPRRMQSLFHREQLLHLHEYIRTVRRRATAECARRVVHVTLQRHRARGDLAREGDRLGRLGVVADERVTKNIRDGLLHGGRGADERERGPYLVRRETLGGSEFLCAGSASVLVCDKGRGHTWSDRVQAVILESGMNVTRRRMWPFLMRSLPTCSSEMTTLKSFPPPAISSATDLSWCSWGSVMSCAATPCTFRRSKFGVGSS